MNEHFTAVPDEQKLPLDATVQITLHRTLPDQDTTELKPDTPSSPQSVLNERSSNSAMTSTPSAEKQSRLYHPLPVPKNLRVPKKRQRLKNPDVVSDKRPPVDVGLQGNGSSVVRSNEITEKQVDATVCILGDLLTRLRMDVPKWMQGSGTCTQESGDHEVYCLTTSFMTTYLMFIDVLLQDLSSTKSILEMYLGVFHANDDLFGNTEDIFLWYYLKLEAWQRECIVSNLVNLFHARGIRFRSLEYVDAIFTRFYTTHFLEVAAQKHQKDHGQFYTPHSVVQFMWSRCTSISRLVESLSAGRVPSVFDPCMGIGSFLCEFLARLSDAASSTPAIWNDLGKVRRLFLEGIPENLWGVEIDPFAFELGKLNILVHLFPFYMRIRELGGVIEPRSVNRLRIFCNDTLQLKMESNPLRQTSSRHEEAGCWEKAQLDRLRDARLLKFDYIVTNPPYMIRKTGRITVPDSHLYDNKILGGKGTQAYLYFMWMCLQRCDPERGQVCLVTPSQWTILEFAKHLRVWMWQHCRLLEFYQLEPYKVWPKVQTDSLVFRIMMRTAAVPDNGCSSTTLFLRHMSRKAGLDEILQAYEDFNETRDQMIKHRRTPTDDMDRIYRSPNASFAFLSPTSRLADQIAALTSHLPRLCDGATTHSDSSTPLIFHRGPNTHPVYALVVRTAWAIQAFGHDSCSRWLRPVFYWSGKSSSSSSSESSSSSPDKEKVFWAQRDPLRLTKKEYSPAEAYVPYYRRDDQDPTLNFYSMILVDKKGAAQLEEDYAAQGESSKDAALYKYLKEARQALQRSKVDRQLAWCHYNKSGLDVPVKIVHPINYGYFSRSQPRQRFFLDKQQMCVTNQCMYFTIKHDYPWQSPEYFCGILNSSTIQFFIREHCFYDQQGRTRFFGKHMASIPAAPPKQEDVSLMERFVQHVIVARKAIFAMADYVPPEVTNLVGKVRNCSWDLSASERLRLQECEMLDWRQPVFNNITDASWQEGLRNIGFVDTLERLLKVASFFQYCIDHLAYAVYQIPEDLQRGLEQELGLTLTETWQEQFGDKRFVLKIGENRLAWGEKMLDVSRTIIFGTII